MKETTQDKELPKQMPFGVDLLILVDPDVPARCSCDVFLDDRKPITVDLPGNRDQSHGSIPLVMHSIGKPLDKIEHVPLHHLMSRKKLASEAALTEKIIMLEY